MTAKEILLSRYPEVADRETFDPDRPDEEYLNALRFEEAARKLQESITRTRLAAKSTEASSLKK